MNNASQRRVSSRDVAREAGVSQSTVSLVVSGRTDTRISEETRQRVLSAAQRLNYIRNSAARALVTGRTHRIGIVPTHPRSFLDHGSYYGLLLDGMMEGVLRYNYNFLLHSCSYSDWRALFQDIYSGGEDGVLLIGRGSSDPLTAEDCDNQEGGYLAIRYLLEQGHRRIAIEDSDDDNSWITERRLGAERAVAEAGLPPETLVRLRAGSFIAAYTAHWVESIVGLMRERAITAVFWNSEAAAEYLVAALQQVGVRVPEDLSVVCFDSTDISRRAQPSLTSVRQPLGEVGAAAVARLIDLVEGRSPATGVHRLPVAIDIRQSSGPAPQKGALPSP